MIGTNTSSDGDLEVLGFGKALSGEVTRVETVDKPRLAHAFESSGWVS